MLQLRNVIVALLSVATTQAASLGHIYALTSNGTTNLYNVVDVDLTTWGMSVGPSLGQDYGTFGQAALYKNGTFWAFAWDKIANFILGFNTTTLAQQYSLNVSAWVHGADIELVSAIFANPRTNGLVVLASSGSGVLVYSVSNPQEPEPAAALLGELPCTDCSDFAWDPATEMLFAVLNEESETSSGNMLVFSTANASAPTLTSNITLQSSFEFPQWDELSQRVTGLTLIQGGPGGYSRNFTLLATSPGNNAYNETSHGTVPNGYFVILEGGPKAFDSVNRRAFYMLATGPFAEFDVVALNVDAVPVTIGEAPSLCGFIGYCPEGFAFGDPGSS